MGIRSPSSLSPIIASNMSHALTAIVPAIEFDLGWSCLCVVRSRPWPIDTAQSMSLHLMHVPVCLQVHFHGKKGVQIRYPKFSGNNRYYENAHFTTDKPMSSHRNSALVNFQREEIWNCFLPDMGSPVTTRHLESCLHDWQQSLRYTIVLFKHVILNIIVELFTALMFESCFQIHGFWRRKVCSILGMLWSVETTVSGVRFWSVYQKENGYLGKSFSRPRHLGMLNPEIWFHVRHLGTNYPGHLQEATH